jgi:hypothetical protein
MQLDTRARIYIPTNVPAVGSVCLPCPAVCHGAECARLYCGRGVGKWRAATTFHANFHRRIHTGRRAGTEQAGGPVPQQAKYIHAHAHAFARQQAGPAQ